jgi:hypothetical protein
MPNPGKSSLTFPFFIVERDLPLIEAADLCRIVRRRRFPCVVRRAAFFTFMRCGFEWTCVGAAC